MALKNLAVYLFLIIVLSCNLEKTSDTFFLVEIPNPSKSGGEPNLFVDDAGVAYLSWVEYINDSIDVLQFSKLENNQWSAAQTIASGQNWFVNWADFPSLAVYPDNKTLAAHWLQKSAAGTYDYDIHIAQSIDDGKSWQKDFILHRDSIAAEHGFVTLLPNTNHRIFATWLDGRNTKTDSPKKEEHGHGHGGAMTLRTAEFDPDGKIYEEAELDDKICDCCQTDAAITANGPVVVYRDRSDAEIRDISIVRKLGPDWTRPRSISNDGWQISGCPVNGPAIFADQHLVAVAWFTAANEKPMVKVIFSDDSGATFSKPVRVDNGDPLGRVDIIFNKKMAYLSWLEQEEDNANIMLAMIDPNSQAIIKKQALVQTAASRKSGFPILECSDNQLLLAWTLVDGEHTRVRTALVK